MNTSTPARSSKAKQKIASPTRARKPASQPQKNTAPKSKSAKKQASHTLGVRDPFEREARAIGVAFNEFQEARQLDDTLKIERPKISLLPSNHPENQSPKSNLASSIRHQKGEGRPLESSLRSDLEDYFGRSLSHIRIHKGTTADRLTRLAGAEAFSSGEHLFFDAPYADFRKTEGHELLAHEIAHSLQQSSTNSKAIQLKGRPQPLYKILGIERSDAVTQVINAHLKKHTTLKDTYLAWWETLKPFLDSPKSFTKEIIESQIKTAQGLALSKGKEAGLALLTDLLKVYGYYGHVVSILRQHPDLQTVYIEPLVIHAINTDPKSEKILKKKVDSSKDKKNFYPHIFHDILKYYGRWSYLHSDLDKRYARRAGKDGKTTVDYKDAAFKGVSDISLFKNNEYDLIASILFEGKEKELINYLKRVDKEFFPKGKGLHYGKKSPVSKHYASLINVMAYGKGIRDKPIPKPASWVGPMIGQAIVDGITQAHDYWVKIDADEKKRIKALKKITTATSIKDTLGEVYHRDPSAAAVIDKYAMSLLSSSKSFFATDVTDIRDQEKIFRNLPSQAETFIKYIDKSILALMKTKSNAKTDSSKELAAGQFAVSLSKLHARVIRVTPKALKRVSKAHRIDRMVQIWIESSAVLWQISSQLSQNLPTKAGDEATASASPHASTWKKLSKLSKSVFNGVGGKTHGLLAITEPFTHDSSTTKIDEFLKDIKHLDDASIPFDIEHLKRFYTLQYNQSVIRKLTEVIGEQNKVPFFQKSLKQLWTFDQAIERVGEDPKVHKLKRYKSEGIIWRDDPTGQATYQYRLGRHHEYKRIKESVQADGRFLLMKYSPTDLKDGRLQATLWSFPAKDSFIAPLRENPTFNGIVSIVRDQKTHAIYFKKETVAKKKHVPGHEKTVVDTTRLDELIAEAERLGKNTEANKDIGDMEWLGHLMKFTEISQRAGVKTAADTVADQTKADLKQSTKDRKKMTTLAISTDRKLIGTQAKGSILDLYKLYEPSDPTTWKYAERANNYVARFYRPLGSLDDKNIQLALLMLEVADGLRQVYIDTDGWNKESIYEYISVAADNSAKAIGSDSKLYLHDKVELLFQVNTLKTARDRIISTQVNLQNRFGIKGFKARSKKPGKGSSDSSNYFQSNLTKSFPVYAGDPVNDDDTKRGFFELGGRKLMLKHVVENFTYFPHVGTWSDDPKKARHLYGRPPVLLRGHHDSVPNKITAEDRFSKSSVLAYVQFKDKDTESPLIPITAEYLSSKYPPSLYWLSSVVHTKANLNNLDNLKYLIETFKDVMMFVLSFTPAGPAIMLAEVLELIAQHQNNEGLVKEIEEALNDPKAVLDHIGNFFEKTLTADYLFDTLINGDFDLGTFIQKTGTHKKAGKTTTRKKGLARTIANLKKLGTVIALRMEDFRNKAQLPVQQLANTVATRPLLARLLAHVAQNYGKSIEQILLDDRIIGPIYEFIYIHQDRILALAEKGGLQDGIDIKEISETMTGITEPINETLKGLTEFEFPETIVPTDEILLILLSAFERFATKRLKGKAKVIAMATMVVSEVAGAKEVLSKELLPIAQGLNLDPNIYWKDSVLPKFKTPVEATIKGMGQELTSVVKQTPILGSFVKPTDLKVPDAKSINISGNSSHDNLFESSRTRAELERSETGSSKADSVDDKDTLTDRSAAFDVNPALDLNQLLSGSNFPENPKTSSNSAGRPLPDDLRSSAEHSFGRSLKHVRLHQDSSSDTLSRSNFAHALTSGSHIFLNNSINPRNGSGREILNHEIAHALQNTGNSEHQHAPIRARPNQPNVSLSENHERGAEQMRKMAADPAIARVPIIGGPNSRYSPRISNKLFSKFLANISDFRSLTKRREETEANATTKTTKINKDVLDTAGDIWDLYYSNLTKAATGNKSYARFLKKRDIPTSVAKYCATRINETAAPSYKTVINGLAEKYARTTKAKNGAKPTHFLHQSMFRKDLEAYLLTRTGIHFTLDNYKYKSAKGAKKASVSATGVRINYVDLHLTTNANKDLHVVWTKAIENTFNKSSRKAYSSSTITRYKNATIGVLKANWASAAGEPYIPIWKGGRLEFSGQLKKLVVTELAPANLDKTKLPPWRAYMQYTKGDTETVAKRMGFPNVNFEVGMHLSTHGHFKSSNYQSLKGADSQSHHTTQYLLPEYFLGKKTSLRPFRSGLIYPGLNIQGNVNSGPDAPPDGNFKNLKDTTLDEIQIKETYRGSARGVPMPAILLSGSVHLGSSLHMAPETQDGVTSPGLAIHLAYKKNIKGTGLGPEVKTQAELNANIKKLNPSNEALAKKMASDKIYNAINKTYGDMHTIMSKGLLGVMPGKAVAYYEKVAKGGDDEDKANLTKLTKDENNKAINSDTMLKDVQQRAKEVYEETPKKTSLDGVAGTVNKNLNDFVMEGLGWKWQK